jgi:hypothetical protein
VRVSVEVTVGIISAFLAVIGICVAYLQLRRTPRTNAHHPEDPADTAPRAPLVLGDVPREPLAHIERDDLLARLAQVLAHEKISILVGGRGVGKTHLAATHVRSRLRDGIARVFWIVAEDETGSPRSPARPCRDLGAPQHLIINNCQIALHTATTRPDRSVAARVRR